MSKNNIEKLTIIEIKDIIEILLEQLNIGEFKRIGKELALKFNLTDQELLMIWRMRTSLNMKQ